MRAGTRQQGFSLIELLVVVTIMMSVIGLVGGGVLKSVQKTEAQTEVISLYSLIKKAGVKAFASGTSLTLLFSGSDVVFVSNGRQEPKQAFQHLQFSAQSIVFNRNGIPNRLELVVSVRGLQKVLELQSLFHSAPFNSGITNAG
jgi:prepilin-type N-terminal cleavage/methylation domain-containing protein